MQVWRVWADAQPLTYNHPSTCQFLSGCTSLAAVFMQVLARTGKMASRLRWRKASPFRCWAEALEWRPR
jgi:hypothetical protein